jgi:uncharacterized protein YbdZ (MbtH family)
MHQDEREDNTIYKVVVNHEEQYSIWPAERESPLGWKVERRLQVFQANRRAMLNYVPRPYVGRTVLFKAGERSTEISQDPTLGWGEMITSGVEIHVVPGNHYTFLKKPHVHTLAEQLRVCLLAGEKDGVEN